MWAFVVYVAPWVGLSLAVSAVTVLALSFIGWLPRIGASDDVAAPAAPRA